MEPSDYEDWMREACIQGTRLEMAARQAASQALTPSISADDHASVLEALTKLEEAREYYTKMAHKHGVEAVHLASLAKQSEAFSGPAVTLRQIGEAVCRKHGITLDELRGPRRNSEYVIVRDEFVYLARNLTQRSYPEIGRWCGGRDHSTIIAAERRHLERMGGA